jgi:hypothetical protein
MQVYKAFPARFYFVALVTLITKLSIQVQLGMLRLFLVHGMGAKSTVCASGCSPNPQTSHRHFYLHLCRFGIAAGDCNPQNELTLFINRDPIYA